MMAKISALVFGAMVAIACGGQVADDSSASTQPLASEGTETNEAPPPPPPSQEEDAKPPCPNPPPRGPACDEANACTSGVCCTGDEPCAGHCVPDCRIDPRPCPQGTTCGSEGVCLRNKP